jgi:hypothetical protein
VSSLHDNHGFAILTTNSILDEAATKFTMAGRFGRLKFALAASTQARTLQGPEITHVGAGSQLTGYGAVVLDITTRADSSLRIPPSSC